MDHSGKGFTYAAQMITSMADYLKAMVEFTDNYYRTTDFKELVLV